MAPPAALRATRGLLRALLELLEVVTLLSVIFTTTALRPRGEAAALDAPLMPPAGLEDRDRSGPAGALDSGRLEERVTFLDVIVMEEKPGLAWLGALMAEWSVSYEEEEEREEVGGGGGVQLLLLLSKVGFPEASAHTGASLRSGQALQGGGGRQCWGLPATASLSTEARCTLLADCRKKKTHPSFTQQCRFSSC